MLPDGGRPGPRTGGSAAREAGSRSVTVNALSGVSGAGAKPSVKTHFVSVNESVAPYGISSGALRHRHTPEIEMMLRRVGPTPEVTFVPHLLPISRGELETIVVEFESGDPPAADEVLGWYAEDYGGWAFVEARAEPPHVSTWRTPTARGSRRPSTGGPESSCSSRRSTTF